MRGPGVLFASIPLMAALALAGCGPNISSIRVGGIYAPNPDSCKVSFENLDYQQATATYEQLGLISVTGGELTDKVRDEVRKKACRMGADVLTLNAAVDTGYKAANMTQFLVLRKKAPATAAAPPQTGI